MRLLFAWVCAGAAVLSGATVVFAQLPGLPAAGPAAAPVSPPPAAPALQVPIDYYRLDNGLKVVLSRATSVPIVTVAVYYHIGFRIEPKGRTGFAHLFEHMMFQGSENLGKMEFIRLVQGSGGTLNGSTRFDYTNYYQVLPAHKLETLLWAEADRMKGLAITEENLVNQRAVVKNEVKVNILNQPYGGFPWLDLPQAANVNWYNAHNFYGDLNDLDAATLAEVKAFFDTYYAPNNAVLVVVGDFDPAAARAWIARYFGPIPRRPVPAAPDVSEPRQEQEKRVLKEDPLAPRPALAVGYHAPPRLTPEHFAMEVWSQILLEGDDSRLHEVLVKQRGLTESVGGGLNLLGGSFSYSGPMLWSLSLRYDAAHPNTEIIAAIDSVLDDARNRPVSTVELERARTKVRSELYDVLLSGARVGLVDLLACFALFDDDPTLVNRLDAGFQQVTPELLQRTAQEYLRPTNRTILTLKPGKVATNVEPAR